MSDEEDGSEGLPYDDDRIREFVESAVAAEGTRRQPRFYAVTGSHVYGFSSASSDVDVRGFHTVPASEYAYLDRPQGEVTVNTDGTTEGFEGYEEIDLRSYELRKFGDLLYQANYNVIELVLETEPVVNGVLANSGARARGAVLNGVALEMEALRSLIRNHLPMNVPHSYLGMAKSVYHSSLDPDKSGYDPHPKHFLYVYRGLLGAQYALDEGDVEADIFELARGVSFGDPDLVADLVEYKREADPGETLPESGIERATDAVTSAFNALDDPGSVEKAGYREAIDDWMRKVRA